MGAACHPPLQPSFVWCCGRGCPRCPVRWGRTEGAGAPARLRLPPPSCTWAARCAARVAGRWGAGIPGSPPGGSRIPHPQDWEAGGGGRVPARGCAPGGGGAGVQVRPQVGGGRGTCGRAARPYLAISAPPGKPRPGRPVPPAAAGLSHWPGGDGSNGRAPGALLALFSHGGRRLACGPRGGGGGAGEPAAPGRRGCLTPGVRGPRVGRCGAGGRGRGGPGGGARPWERREHRLRHRDCSVRSREASPSPRSFGPDAQGAPSWR